MCLAVRVDTCANEIRKKPMAHSPPFWFAALVGLWRVDWTGLVDMPLLTRPSAAIEAAPPPAVALTTYLARSTRGRAIQ